MARLFFALWPDAAARPALTALSRELAGQCGGRATPEGKIHLTLAFLGETPADRLPAVLEVARAVRGERFAARLDRAGSFSKSDVAWAGMSVVPPELEALAAELARGLRGAGFALEDRPFAAHVTLARRIRHRPAEAPIAPITWRAQSFALVESDRRTGNYETRGSWELGAR